MMNGTGTNISNYLNKTEVGDNNSECDYDNGFVFDTSLILAIVSIIVATPLTFGIIFYEKFGSDKKRTLVNKLISSFCYTIIAWFLIIQTFTLARFIHGPFSGLYNSLQ
jgi:hypothetical protein